MKNRRPNIKSILFILLFLCVLSMQLYSEDTRVLLLTTEIQNSTQAELERRVVALGLTPAGDLEALQEQLYAFYGFAPSVLTVEEITRETGYQLEILQADRLLVKQTVTDSTLVLLEGEVKIRFRGSSDANPQELEAARILIDLDGHQLSALGTVVFRDAQGTLLEQVEGEIVTYDWIEDDIRISKGTTSMVRQNSEDVEIEFFTSGEMVTFLGDGGSVQFNKGFITTNLENAYFSISAEKLLMLNGGDMFVEQAWISIGRIPMLWIPFLYYPGQTFIFNPAFGFDQDRGYFFSTTTELFGMYDKIEKSDESSFTTLLSSGDEGQRIRDGWVYRTDDSKNQNDSESKLNSWASKTNSYMVLFGDTYQNRGTFLGLDTVDNFSDNRYVLSITGGIAYWGNNTAVTSVYEIPSIRYFLDGKFVVKTTATNLSLSLPFYSDPKVKIDYGNRLTSFSLGSLLGNQDFPDTFRSDITSFTWALDGSITIPVGILNPFVSSLKINQMNARVVWKAKSIATDDDSGYYLASMVVPDFRASIAGTLFSWKKAIRTTLVESETPLNLDIGPASEQVANQSSGWNFSLTGIDPPYSAPKESIVKKTASTTQSHSLELSYTAEQLLVNSNQIQNLQTTDNSIYAKTQGSLMLKASIAPDILNLDTQLNPLFTLNADAATSSSRLQLLTNNKISIPYLGLSYALSARIYTLSIDKSESLATVSTETWGDWDTDTITTHQLIISRPISLGSSTLTASLTGVLPPLTISLTPKLQFRRGGFLTSIGYKVVENSGGGFSGEMLSFNLSYEDNRALSLILNSTYDTSRYSVPSTLFTWDPFSANGGITFLFFEKNLELIQKFSYSAETDIFNSLESTIRTPWFAAIVKSAGKLNELELLGVTLTTQVKDLTFSWWRNRINLGIELLSAFHYSFSDDTATNLKVTAGLRFNIAEFLDLKLSVTSVNKGFSTYASFGDMMEDLLRSFDFFGEGRKSTQFNMETVSLEIVHYMDDWDLHCKYAGSVVLSNMEWIWKPVLTVFLQWKAIPEIKVDKRFDL